MLFDKVAEADTAGLWSEWRRKKRILQERTAKSLHDGGKSCYLTNDCSLTENPLFAQLLNEGVGDYMAFPSTIEYGAHLRADEYKVEEYCAFELWREKCARKFKNGYAYGVFDMFHAGHLNILKRAKEQCDFLTVAVSTNAPVEKIKHKKPV